MIILKWWFIILVWIPMVCYVVIMGQNKIISYEIKYENKYRVIKTKRKFIDKLTLMIVVRISLLFLSFIPLANIIMAFGFIARSDEIKENVINGMIKRGELEEIEWLHDN